MMTIRTAAEARALGTVLGVWAHPDDETYLSSGLMALARRAGNRVVCVTATRGEHGTDDPRNWPPARLARTRTYELAAAMTVLGVDEHRWLDFEDGTLARLDLAHGAAMVTDLLAEIRLDDELADLKLAALRTQATQVKPLIDAVGVDRFRQWWQVERFRSAAPTR